MLVHISVSTILGSVLSEIALSRWGPLVPKYTINILFENKDATQEFFFLAMHGLAHSQ